MINCPMQAVPKLHEALVEDIAWAVDNEVCFSFSLDLDQPHIITYTYAGLFVVRTIASCERGLFSAEVSPSMIIIAPWRVHSSGRC